MRARKFTDMCISCLNNALLRDWLDCKTAVFLDILKAAL